MKDRHMPPMATSPTLQNPSPGARSPRPKTSTLQRFGPATGEKPARGARLLAEKLPVVAKLIPMVCLLLGDPLVVFLGFQITPKRGTLERDEPCAFLSNWGVLFACLEPSLGGTTLAFLGGRGMRNCCSLHIPIQPLK